MNGRWHAFNLDDFSIGGYLLHWYNKYKHRARIKQFGGWSQNVWFRIMAKDKS
jgi:hypothetical protein